MTSRRSNRAATLAAVAGLALLLAACGGPGAPGASTAASPTPATAAGDIHLRISEAFDNRATVEDMWNSGTITADGVFSPAKLDTMDLGVIYDGNDIGPVPWSASTQQDSGDFEGACDGGDDCHPCTGTYNSTWAIPSVDFTVQERGNGRYVIDLWLGNDLPPKTAGCDPMVAGPVTWSDNITVTLTGIGGATPQAVAVSPDGSEAYTVELNP